MIKMVKKLSIENALREPLATMVGEQEESLPPKDKSWKCSHCGVWNNLSMLRCRRCGRVNA